MNVKKRVEKRRIRQNALKRLEVLSPKKCRIEPLRPDEKDESSPVLLNSSVCDKCEFLLEENNNLKASVDTLQKKLTSLKTEHDLLYKAIIKKKKIHSRTLRRHAQKVRQLNDNLAFYKKRYEQNCKLTRYISKFLSPSQIKFLQSKGKITRWSNEDLSRAIMIRALSRKSYDFWREKMEFPLPSATTLRRWCA